MVNTKYIRQLCKDILEIKIEDIYILEVRNEVKHSDIKEYTVYVEVTIENQSIDTPLNNIYPITHSIEDSIYIYNNLSEEETILLSDIMNMLDINVSLMSKEQYSTRIELLSKQKRTLDCMLDALEQEIKVYKSMNENELAYNKYLIQKSLIKDMKSIQLIP